MIAAASSRNFSWSFKLGTLIMLNVLEAFNEILRRDYRFNNCYSLFIKKIAMFAPDSQRIFSGRSNSVVAS